MHMHMHMHMHMYMHMHMRMHVHMMHMHVHMMHMHVPRASSALCTGLGGKEERRRVGCAHPARPAVYPRHAARHRRSRRAV